MGGKNISLSVSLEEETAASGPASLLTRQSQWATVAFIRGTHVFLLTPGSEEMAGFHLYLTRLDLN